MAELLTAVRDLVTTLAVSISRGGVRPMPLQPATEWFLRVQSRPRNLPTVRPAHARIRSRIHRNLWARTCCTRASTAPPTATASSVVTPLPLRQTRITRCGASTEARPPTPPQQAASVAWASSVPARSDCAAQPAWDRAASVGPVPSVAPACSDASAARARMVWAGPTRPVACPVPVAWAPQACAASLAQPTVWVLRGQPV